MNLVLGAFVPVTTLCTLHALWCWRGCINSGIPSHSIICNLDFKEVTSMNQWYQGCTDTRKKEDKGH